MTSWATAEKFWISLDFGSREHLFDTPFKGWVHLHMLAFASLQLASLPILYSGNNYGPKRERKADQGVIAKLSSNPCIATDLWVMLEKLFNLTMPRFLFL